MSKKGLTKRAGFSDQLFKRVHGLRQAASKGVAESAKILGHGIKNAGKEIQGFKQVPKGAKSAYVWTRVVENPNPFISGPANLIGGKLVGLLAIAGVPDSKLSDLLYAKAIPPAKEILRRAGESSAGKRVLKYYRQATETEPVKRLRLGVQKTSAGTRSAVERLKAKLKDMNKDAVVQAPALDKQALNFNPIGMQLAKPKVIGIVNRLKKQPLKPKLKFDLV